MKILKAFAAAPGAALLLALLLASPREAGAGAQGTIVKKDGGTPITGVLQWKAGSRGYEVAINNVTVDIPLAQVESITIATPPAGLDAAIKMVRSGQPGPAIPTLRKIVDDYLMLQYDQPAAVWLAEAYLKSNRAKDAVAVCKEVKRHREPSEVLGELTGKYCDALLADNQFSELGQVLDEAIASGSHEQAAVAQMKRGDMQFKKQNYRDALVDGYLRTVVLFSDMRDLRPEALFKSMKAFEQLQQTTYAEKMRRMLLAEFPNDPYAQQAKSGQ